MTMMVDVDGDTVGVDNHHIHYNQHRWLC